jgi:hypothetical protein
VSAAQPQAAQAELAASGAGVVLQPAVWDAAAERRQAAGPGAEVLLPEEGAERDVAVAVLLQAAEPASVAVRLWEAQVAVPDAEEAPLQEAEVLAAAEVPQQVARDEGVRLLAAAWAGLLSIRLQGGRLAPSALARSAHARGCLRTARP